MVTTAGATGNQALILKGSLNIAFTLFMIAAVIVILSQALTRWINVSRGRTGL